VPGKVIGPSFAADEIADAVEAVLDTYRARRQAGERFIDTVRRLGIDALQGRPMPCAAPPHRPRPPPDRASTGCTMNSSIRTTTPGAPLGGEDGP
jgi:hypothetical protein